METEQYERPVHKPHTVEEKASFISKYIIIMIGNICAVTVAYFGLTNNFVLPQTLQIMGIMFAIWIASCFIVHLGLKPFILKFLQNRAAKKA